jgi:hypothetical protein
MGKSIMSAMDIDALVQEIEIDASMTMRNVSTVDGDSFDLIDMFEDIC